MPVPRTTRAAPNHQQQSTKTQGAPLQAVSGAFRQNKNAGKRLKLPEAGAPAFWWSAVGG
eukprot:15476424-Alexandrium_andersonii.AAC.1